MRINRSVLKGSLILLITFNLFNLLNFVFHFSMVRLLSVEDYGILATLFTITYILAVFSESIQVVITKYSSEEEEKGRLKNLLKKAFKKSFVLSTGMFLVYAIVSIFLAAPLKISYWLLCLNGFVIFTVFFAPITRGILQGKKRFKALGGNMISEATIKLVLAVVFVVIGWGVYGAIIGTLVGMFFAILLSFIHLRDIVRSDEKSAKTEGIYGYGRPAFIVTLVILVFCNIDLIVARFFFSSEVSGIYAIASVLAKTIFMGTQPISKAMFPITSEAKKDKLKSGEAFSNSLAILGAIILVALALFYFFPELIIRIYSGKEIYESARLLIYLGVAMSLVSVSNLVLLYKLSIGQVKKSFRLLIFLVIEIGLLSYFSNNLVQFSIAFITASAIFLWGSIYLFNE